jgi:hypothetical protein
MEPSEALSTTALVAITLAGFTGVVVVFGGGSLHEWTRVDRFRLQLLLTFSLLPLGLSLVGLFFLVTPILRSEVWFTSSAVATAVLVTAGALNLRHFLHFSRQELSSAGASRVVFYSASAAGAAAILLQIYNLVRLQQFWPFLAALVLQILVASLQFARLVMKRPSPK